VNRKIGGAIHTPLLPALVRHSPAPGRHVQGFR